MSGIHLQLMHLAAIRRRIVRDMEESTVEIDSDIEDLVKVIMPMDTVVYLQDFEGDDFDGLFIEMHSRFELFIPL
jgi:hypothetical protein